MPLWKRNLFICWLGSFICVAGMALVLPFLPLYLQELGLRDLGAVEQWAGVAFGATFLMAALVSPVWGRLADTHGRKLMLIRASLGMAIVTTLMGFVTAPWQLVALRFFMGAVSGYVSASITLVATQTPRENAGWALGTLTTGTVCGGLIGPLLGGFLAEAVGLRHVFFVTGFAMFLAFVLTWRFLVETFEPSQAAARTGREVWAALEHPGLLVAMFVTTFGVQAAAMSIEPVVTVYVQQLVAHSGHVPLLAGAVVAASGFATAIAAPQLGRLSDRIGPRRVLVGCLLIGGLLFIPQALVRSPWELMAWRFCFGLAAGGLTPAVNGLVRRLAPDQVAGRIYGYNQSAGYLGNLAGPVAGGVIAAHLGIPAVFLATAALLLANAGWVAYHAQRAAPMLRPAPAAGHEAHGPTGPATAARPEASPQA